MAKYGKDSNIKRLGLALVILSLCSLITTTAITATAMAEESLAKEGVFEDFNNGRSDRWIDDGSGVWFFTDEVYRMSGTGAGALRVSCYNAAFDNFSYRVDVRRVQGNPDASQGMIFRLNNNGDFYIFAISSRGYCSAYKFHGINGSELIPWTPTSAVKQGLKVWNTLEVVCNGSNMDFYINGELMKTVIDNSSPRSGMVGVVAVDETKGDQGYPVVDFDNVRLSRSVDLSLRVPPVRLSDLTPVSLKEHLK